MLAVLVKLIVISVGIICSEIPKNLFSKTEIIAYNSPRQVCRDINECEVEGACFRGCVNKDDGYECEPCPDGYSGSTPSGTVIRIVTYSYTLLCEISGNV